MARPKKEGVSEETKSKLAELEEKYGKGIIIKASDEEFEEVKEFTPTGSLTLDIATKIGGIPKGGKLTHILGKESSSKTTLSLHIIAEEQKKGNDCAFLDVEGTLSLAYAKDIGVNLEKLYLLNQRKLLDVLKIKDRKAISGEEWLEVLVDILKTDSFGVVVLDSIATLTPVSELQKGINGGGAIASVGSMLSKAMRNVNAHLVRTNTALVFLNQYRISPGSYGNPFVEVGGEAIKYYACMKIELSKSLDKDAEGVYGIQVRAKITKSKVGNPYGEASYYVEFGKGIQRIEEVLDLAIEQKIIVQSGSWFSHEDNKLGQGRDAIKQLLLDNADFYSKIEQMVIEKIKL